jgi:hypothetical protein
MRMQRLAFALALALPLAAPPPARACSVCLAGDPHFSSFGASAQEQGNVSVYFQAQGWRKDSGALPHDEPQDEGHDEAGHDEAGHDEAGHDGGGHDEETEHRHDAGDETSRGERLDLFVSWTPLDRLTLTLDVPWAFNRIVSDEDGERTRSTLSGLGDVSLTSSVVLWRDREVLPATWLEGRLFLKAPSGRDDREVDGIRDPHLQTGTGSWDFGFGLAATHRLPWGSLYGSVLWRENTPGALDYEYGDVLLANAAFEVPVGHAFGVSSLSWLTAGTELNFRYAGYDHADGTRYADSGGAILYATPSLRVQLPWKLGEKTPSLRASVQLPLGRTWLHNEQDEGPVWSVGLLLPL